MRLVISGTVGVGKSTTTQLLVKTLEEKGYTVNHLKEETADSPYLGFFYAEPEKWAFIAQVDFLLERFKQWLVDEQQRKIQEEEGLKVISIYDRHYLDDYLFAELNSLRQSINHLNSVVYHSVYKELLEKLHDFGATPDYFLLLEADLSTIVSRLKKRGREAEMDTDESYWRELYDSYYVLPKFEYHFKKNSKNYVRVNTENLSPEQVVENIIKELNL